MGRTECVLGLAVTACLALPARADTAATPWLDEHPSPVLAPPAPDAPPPDARSWRFLAATMLGIRGDQGGLLDSGSRFVGILGVITPPPSAE